MPSQPDVFTNTVVQRLKQISDPKMLAFRRWYEDKYGVRINWSDVNTQKLYASFRGGIEFGFHAAVKYVEAAGL